MTDPSLLSVLPPVLAVILAITTRQVLPSLFAGIWIGYTLMEGFNPLGGLAAAIEGIVAVFGDAGDTRVLLFTLLIGSLIATIEHSGGVRGFVRFLETRRWVDNGKRSQLLAWLIGLVIFIESNITLLVAGSVSRPLFDRYRVSREKLAYIIDSTSAPVCVMVPMNAWGAFIISLVASTGLRDPFAIFFGSLALNFYAIAAILLVGFVIWRGLDLGPMKKAEARTRDGQLLWPDATPIVVTEDDENAPTRSAAYMLVPVVTMIAMMPVSLAITGDGDLAAGSGSTSIIWSVGTAIVVAWCMLVFGARERFSELMRIFMNGAAALLPISTILLLALALGDVANHLGTGTYVAGVVGENLPRPLLAPLVFLVAAFISFSVGSSWGTFAIMIPIAVPIAVMLGLSVPLLLAAAVSGAIFGDHASPISDTTIVASMASGTDHIDHVRTQLPYALLAGSVALVLFFVFSLIP